MNLKLNKIMEKTISVIGGAGHIGLPLCYLLSKHGFKVIGIDKDKQKIKMINNKQVPFIEKGLKNLINKNLNVRFSSKLEEIKNSKYIIITLGTPIDEYLNPSYTNFFKVINEIITHLNDKQVLILRSTLAPGTSRKILDKIRKRNLKTGVAFCPERISQGNAINEIYDLPQIISYSDNKTKIACKKIFSKFNKELIECSFEEAEVTKLFCNSWRYIKFAVANEFFKITKLHNLNFEKIRNTMMYKYERAKDFPKSGFAAGPCLLKDTMQLSSYSREHFTFGTSAMLVNESLPEFIIDDAKKKFKIKGKKILILGMAFKSNNDDARDSLAFRLKKKLTEESPYIYCHDPYIEPYKNNKVNDLIKKCSIIFIGCPHSQYKNLKIPKSKAIIDCWGFV